MKKIEILREKINAIDERLVDLINQRTSVALEIGKVKAGLRQPIYSPQREREVYGRLLKNSKGPMRPDSLKAVFREIMSGALSLEKELLVSYLGPQATFTHQAALAKFGSSVQYLAMKSIHDVFNEVEKGYADYGVVPIENSIEGAVNHTLDMFIDSNLKIYSEIYLDIAQHLMGLGCPPKSKGGNRFSGIKKIYSISQAIGQCRQWIQANVPQAEVVEVSSTSRAAEIAAKEKGEVAIASELAAQLYGLTILARSIQDSTDNITRFFVIAKTFGPASGHDKTSIMFAAKDRVGALYHVLGIFAAHNINLTKIESRPSKKKPWQYYFFVDFKGHCDEAPVRSAMKKLAKKCEFLKVLGSYPRAEE